MATLVHSSWIEVFATWAQTIWDRTDSRLNAGITMKVSPRHFGRLHKITQWKRRANRAWNRCSLHHAGCLCRICLFIELRYWKKIKSTNQNLRDFVTNTQGGISFDLGAEYIIKTGQISSVFDDDDYYDYNWKIGLSLIDIGFNQFKYGAQSRILSGFQNNITDTTLDVRFTEIDDLAEFNERLNGVARTIQQPGGYYKIVNPTRVVLNVDHFITGAWYVNGNVSVNLSSLSGGQWRLTELNMLTVTPRWETRRLGFYMPVHFNSKEQFWVGGAIKAGPLLLGVHNWATVFAKKQMQNGGAYIALVIRPGSSSSEREDKRLSCPRVGNRFTKNRLGQKQAARPVS